MYKWNKQRPLPFLRYKRKSRRTPWRVPPALPLPSHRRLATTDLNAATALPFWEHHRSGTTQIWPFRVAFLHSAM